MKIFLTALPLAWIPVCQWLGANFKLVPATVISGLFVFITAMIVFMGLHRRLSK